jgi:hypothetical protein
MGAAMQRLLFAKIEAWVVLLFGLLGILAMLAFGFAALDVERGAARTGVVGKVAHELASIPYTIDALSKADMRMVVFAARRLSNKPAGWTFDPALGPRLTGYLLLSRYDGDSQRHVIELVSLADGQVHHRWMPDADELLANSPRDSPLATPSAWTKRYYRAIHPLPLENGDLIIKDHQTPLFRIDACGGMVWKQDKRLFHHSTESDGAGGVWVPSLIEPHTTDRTAEDFVEGGLAHVSADGKILEEISLVGILMRHGMEYDMFTFGDYQNDPVHLNDIQPVLSDGPYWKKGDLFLSMRNLSMVMLYRPSTDQIIWMKQGPWLAQHDINILDDHRIGIFDNFAYERGTGGRVHGTNRIAVYDFTTGTVTFPFAEAMQQQDVKTLFEGLYDPMPDGGIVIEEDNAGRIVVLTATGKLAAEYINKATNKRVYRMGWSRYIPPAEGDRLVKKLAASTCAG